MKDKLEIRRIGDIDVYFRKDNIPLTVKSQPKELEKMISYLTNEKFEDYDGKYKRRIIHPENFEIFDEYIEEKVVYYICLCSENTCNHLVIIKHIPTNIYFTVGSVCYLRFNEENSTDLYYKLKAKKCSACKNPLVYKECKYKKNTDKKSNGICYNCINKKEVEEMKKGIYLFVKYEDKDDAKSLGAKWDAENKRWYAPNKELTALLKQYKPYPLNIL